MSEWKKISDGLPPPNDLIIFYSPDGLQGEEGKPRYIPAEGYDLDLVKKDYPNITHWMSFTSTP